MKTLSVVLGERSYPIYIGADLLGRPEFIVPHLEGRQVLIVSNTTVAPLYLEKIMSAFESYETASVILPDGEVYKTLAILSQIFDVLLSQHFDRQSVLVALGGGVVGDVTGFAAASYQRGVNFIQIPTTLLAQVDSSVGGKTGVNHPLGKNMIGAFHQPHCVVIDTTTLNTLPDRELSAGLAEVVKYGLVNDLAFFDWLEVHSADLLARESNTLAYAIERSCQNKAWIVAQDERESGMRALLNLGHTFGHAIETGAGYGRYLHGEAVAIGMVLAASVSVRLGWLKPVEFARIEKLLQALRLPTRVPPELDVRQLLELMKVDKKVRAGKIHLVLMESLGQSVVTDQCPPHILQETLAGG